MQHKGPWVVQDSTLRYKNDRAEIKEDKILRPDGGDGTFTVVRLQPGVSVLAIDADDTVYLTKEYRHAIEQESVEVVSGAIEENEQ